MTIYRGTELENSCKDCGLRAPNYWIDLLLQEEIQVGSIHCVAVDSDIPSLIGRMMVLNVASYKELPPTTDGKRRFGVRTGSGEHARRCTLKDTPFISTVELVEQ